MPSDVQLVIIIIIVILCITLYTGLTVGSYCGADGVDDWDDIRWRKELKDHQVLVLVHQVGTK